tara:strand:- start:1648 stop:2313 length:666 start_codon:yes stop_codon:yes gene_type:complete
MIKRLIDIFLSVFAIICFLPFGIIIIIILKLTGEGETFYFQKRVGQNGDSFYLYKFATMLKNSSKIGTKNITLRNDPRVLPFGKLLRKTKLNEVPQIINVIKGDLSIVGPRPLTRDHYNMIPDVYRKKIKKIKPGITGIGSIIFRDEEYLISNNDDPEKFYKEKIAPYKGQLESWYFDNNSILIDIKIILITAIVIIFPKSNIHKKFFDDLPKSKIFYTSH